jgi:stage II sporulation protein R
MKTKIIALFCACFLLLTVVDMTIPRSEANIFDNVIRLHILAYDDSDEAQALKLKVRDAILENCGHLFSSQEDVCQAEEALMDNLPLIESIANQVLAENGVEYKATAEFGIEEYPTRVYEGFTLPAGSYRSLRLLLGNGEGQNWWCVLFPPLCTNAASQDLSSAKVNKNDTSVFQGKKYIFRFKFLEWFR